MNNSETTFENAKVGDRVYYILLRNVNKDDKTNAYIKEINPNAIHPIIIESDIEMFISVNLSFTFGGQSYIDGGQTLFWENPIKEIPVRQKRIVKKTGYVGLIISPVLSVGRLAITTNVYDSSENMRKYNLETYKSYPVEFEIEE